MTRTFRLVFAVLALCLAAPAHADQALDSFARDVDRTEEPARGHEPAAHLRAIRAVRPVERGRRAVRAGRARFTFDGLVMPAQTAKGPAAIAAFLRTRYGGGYDGLSATASRA